jgi:hypothetical protein
MLLKKCILFLFLSGITPEQLINVFYSILKTSGGYRVPCDLGEAYIGETAGRTVETILKEHMREPHQTRTTRKIRHCRALHRTKSLEESFRRNHVSVFTSSTENCHGQTAGKSQDSVKGET